MKNESKEKNLIKMRHSCAHLLAAAVLKMWPDTKLGIGPAIDEGFYYDFEFKKPISEDHLSKIEKEMKIIQKTWKRFERSEKTISEAKRIVKNQPYKLDLIKELSKESNKVSFYKSGNFIDLCRGGHVENSKHIGPFKLLSVAGAYWRGSENNPMLTRIYGTCFEKQSDLENYLNNLKSAKEIDHRKIGKELEIFAIDNEVGPGLPLWLPKGESVREALEKFIKDLEKLHGYQYVSTPHVGKLEIYKTSGHWQHYKELMFPVMKRGSEKYLLRAMNCPHHIAIFKNTPKSYKDLPYKLAENGTVYRFEKSGELLGLNRVRSFMINDGHIFCTTEQINDQVAEILKIMKKLFNALNFSGYRLVLATRDPKDKKKYVDDSKMWLMAEKSLKHALEKQGEEYNFEVGEAAYYGPKIDILTKDVSGRETTLSTIQLDFYLPKRFSLEYTDKNGKKATPVLIHRAIIGSYERFVGFLLEHTKGKLPLWVAPIQTKIIPIADRHHEYARDVLKELISVGIRAEVDNRSETLQSKIRDAQLQQIPYMLIVGDRERVQGKVAVRSREKGDLGTKSTKSFKEGLLKEIETTVNYDYSGY